MHRRTFLRTSSLTIASLALLNKNSLAAFLANPVWNIQMLTNDIGIFTEKGGTIAFYLSAEGTVVVDAQFPDSAQHLIDELKKKSENPFRLLINTHHHGDHTSGNIAFKGLVTHVLAHTNSKANQERVAKEQNIEDKQLYPDQVYTNIWSEKIGKEKISLYYYGAGHTNGDSLVHFEKANIIHMGDLVFNRRHPYVDKTAGASISNWIKVLEKTTTTFSKKTQYVCGHAGDGYGVHLNTDDLKAFGHYLENVLKFTEGEIKSGKSKEEILKATEIPGSPEWKGDGIARPLTAAYTELTTK
ncbi:MAG TPA: MBL fold metallo-hydrolase [Ferruginibacter sp.]|nr:MBL fold metallo-hydrolase [Ferruginibacter sp.]